MGNSEQEKFSESSSTKEVFDDKIERILFQEASAKLMAKMMSKKFPATRQNSQRGIDWSQTSWRGKPCAGCAKILEEDYLEKEKLSSEFIVDYDIVTISRQMIQSRDMGSSIQSHNSVFEYFFFHKDCFKQIAGDEYLPKKDLTTGKIME